ncbi:GMC family oxidoreductase [Frigidibacter sp. MR17.14]|uniref:GMC family oxidoreductase n=1 Tax=Frigidibacter sp. MR17.14 TaxID=3126509 RepID=UPI003012B9F3
MTAFVDARDPSAPRILRGSVCIVGAGAAGITLARALAKTRPGVLLIESGGLEIDGATQMLFAGHQLGQRYFELTSCRLRYFGGTTNHWSGFCRANDPIDYEPRPALGLPGWPIGHEDLAPYIEAAGASLGITAAAFDPAAVVRGRGLDPDQLVERHGTHLMTKIFELAPDIRLGQIFRDEIATAPGVTPVLNLSVTKIALDPTGTRVDHLEARTLSGVAHRIEAEDYVLCAHAIENARLMLASDDVIPQGVGNAHDLVGRYFSDHAHVEASRFIPSERFPALYDFDAARRRRLNANLSFTDDFLREQGLLQYYCRFTPVYVSPEAEAARGRLKADLLAPADRQLFADIAAVMAELDGTRRWRQTRRSGFRPPPVYLLDHRIEQAPNRDSRVVLSQRRDALGSRIADLDWRVSDADIDTIARGQRAIGRELAALGYGRIEEEEITRPLVEARVEGHYHHIGTLRMADRPEEGVVDRWQKVHGVANLHVGGSAVFPSAGYSGPTMMIIAMSLRLAERLGGRA